MKFNSIVNLILNFDFIFKNFSLFILNLILFGHLLNRENNRSKIITNRFNVKATAHKVRGHRHHARDVRQTNAELNEPEPVPASKSTRVKWNRHRKGQKPSRSIEISDTNQVE